MSTPIEPQKLRLAFDVEPTASGFAAVATAIEKSLWTAAVLGEPALLFLADVVQTLGPVELLLQRSTYEPWRNPSIFGKKSQLSSGLVEHVDRVVSFLEEGELQRPSYMGDIAWTITKHVAGSMRLLSRALHTEDDELIRKIFLPLPPEQVLKHEDWVPRLSPPEGGRIVLAQVRHDLDPKIVEMRPGSVIVSVIAIGGPLLLPVVGVLTARSIVKRNNSEAIKARAEAAKSGAEARLADSQRIKVVAETEKLRAETAELHLNLIKQVIDDRQALTWQARDAIVAMVLKLETRSNAGIDGPFAAAARQLVNENLDSLIFLAQRIKEVEGGDD